MTPSWRQQLADYIRAQAQPVDKFSHQPRLYALACELADGLPLDDDMAVIGGTYAFLGAVGDYVQHSAEESTITVWVPRLPRF